MAESRPKKPRSGSNSAAVALDPRSTNWEKTVCIHLKINQLVHQIQKTSATSSWTKKSSWTTSYWFWIMSKKSLIESTNWWQKEGFTQTIISIEFTRIWGVFVWINQLLPRRNFPRLRQSSSGLRVPGFRLRQRPKDGKVLKNNIYPPGN